jgi:hypothetical protein
VNKTKQPENNKQNQNKLYHTIQYSISSFFSEIKC